VKFDATYEEEAVLRDGTKVVLRLVRPDDKPLFVEGFTHLSPQSRYLRFFTGKDQLSERELSYLTELDGLNHLAIGAIAGGRGLGVARFVRLRDEPDVAELAVTVIHDLQRRGLGRLLSDRVVKAARERGVRRIRAEILPSNAAMLGLVKEMAATVRHEEDSALVVDFELPPPVPAVTAPPTLVQQLLQMVASGLIAVRRAMTGR